MKILNKNVFIRVFLSISLCPYQWEERAGEIVAPSTNQISKMSPNLTMVYSL